MYRKILCALDHTSADETLLLHIVKLAGPMNSELLLLHVADGWVARNYEQLQLAQSEEMKDDWNRLEEAAARLRAKSGLHVGTCLALGNPPSQIVKVAAQERCDLIAMTSHQHGVVGDIIHGSTINAVRHKTHVPILAIPERPAAT